MGKGRGSLEMKLPHVIEASAEGWNFYKCVVCAGWLGSGTCVLANLKAFGFEKPAKPEPASHCPAWCFIVTT